MMTGPKRPLAPRSGWRWLKRTDFQPFIGQLAAMEAAVDELGPQIDKAAFAELLPLIQRVNGLLVSLAEQEAAFERLLIETRGRGATMLLVRQVSAGHLDIRETLGALLKRIGTHPGIPGTVRQ